MTDEVVAPDPAVIEPNTSGVVGVLAKALQGKLLLMIDSLLDEAEPANHAEDDFHAGVIAGLSQAHHVIRTMLPAELASVVAALPNIAIVPDDAIIPGLGAELRGCIEEYLSGWASTDDAVQPLVGSYFAEGLSDQIGPIIAAARAARAAGGQA